VTATLVHQVLEGIWTEKHETATRVRSRIENVLDYAISKGYREGPNPARLKGNLDHMLAPSKKVAKVEHHAALDVVAMPAFWERLRAVEGQGATALAFAILTAARSGEVRGATWAEIDFNEAVWTVPASRMKMTKEHRVPLSTAARELLLSLPEGGPDELVLPSATGKPLSDMTLTAALRRRTPFAADAVDQGGTAADRGGSRVVGEIQRDKRGRATGALHLPLGSAMTIERDGAGNIIGVKSRDA